jgi:hypothetical protein
MEVSLRPYAPGPLAQTIPGTNHWAPRGLGADLFRWVCRSVRVLMACPSPYSLPAAVLYPLNSRNYQVSSPESYSFFSSLYYGITKGRVSVLGIRPREKIEFYFVTCVYLAFLSRVPGAVWGLRHGVFLVCIARMFQTREEGRGGYLCLGLV